MDPATILVLVLCAGVVALLISFEVGIRLTQGMPASCDRADLIQADHTAHCGHLSEADTHLQ